jgi:hypothetical protein
VISDQFGELSTLREATTALRVPSRKLSEKMSGLPLSKDIYKIFCLPIKDGKMFIPLFVSRLRLCPSKSLITIFFTPSAVFSTNRICVS